MLKTQKHSLISNVSILWYLMEKFQSVDLPQASRNWMWNWSKNVGVSQEIEVSFSCVHPVVDHDFRHNIVKVAVDPQTTLKML